jgi:hypothetical protein
MWSGAERSRPRPWVGRGRLLWSMGKAAGRAVAPHWRLCRIAGSGGQLRARGDLAMVCSRSAGSSRPRACGKSPKESQ